MAMNLIPFQLYLSMAEFMQRFGTQVPRVPVPVQRDSGAVFQNTKLPLTVWFLAMHLLTQTKDNVADLELVRHPGVC